MNKNKNFFDELDGGWGDLIADTYKEANTKPVLDFPLNVSNPNPVTYNGKKVINVIIYESENMRNWVEKINHSTVIIYKVYFCNIPLKSIRYILEDGTEITPKLLPDDKRVEEAKGKVSFRVLINQYIKDRETIYYLLSMSNSKMFNNHDSYKTYADGYILNNLNSTYEDESKHIGLHLDIINSLKEKGFDINNEQE